jgi:hypothetical protein
MGRRVGWEEPTYNPRNNRLIRKPLSEGILIADSILQHDDRRVLADDRVQRDDCAFGVDGLVCADDKGEVCAGCFSRVADYFFILLDRCCLFFLVCQG